VTLQGDKADWKNILDRLGKFAEYGDEPEASARLLEAIVKRFVATFERPEEERELREFCMLRGNSAVGHHRRSMCS
jgi:hypothetical protein